MASFLEALKNGRVQMGQLDSALAEHSRACSVKPNIKLVNEGLWKEFHQHTNEMIITKAGRRMFPLIQLILEGLDPNATYTLLLALRVKDPSRWRFLNGEWIGSESAIRGVTSEAGPGEGYVYVHPRSPLTGEEWMRESPVGFSKLKLSNKDSEGGKAKLSSLHRYQPVAYLVKLPSQAEETVETEQGKASVTSPPSLEERDQAVSAEPPLVEISEQELPETQFIAVTAYQNDLITQMKIKHNPFAKAFLPNQDKAPAASMHADGPSTRQEYTVRPPHHLPEEHESLHWPPHMQHQASPYQHPPYFGYYGDARYAHPSYMETYESYPSSMSYHS